MSVKLEKKKKAFLDFLQRLAFLSSLKVVHLLWNRNEILYSLSQNN